VTDVVKSVSVMEGDSVTLKTDVTELQREDLIMWMFNVYHSDICIAEIHNLIISIFDKDEKFRNRLKMDSQTGSLTIRNIRSEHTGLYKLQVRVRGGVTYRSFTVSVHGE